MGALGEGLLGHGLAKRNIVEVPDVDNFFTVPRFFADWEEVALALLNKGLQFIVLLQDKIDDLDSKRRFTEELHSCLKCAEKTNRRPALAIVFCADRNYEAHDIASYFSEDTSVVQVDVRHSIFDQRRGHKEEKDIYRQKSTGFPARFALYVTTAFTKAMFETTELI